MGVSTIMQTATGVAMGNGINITSIAGSLTSPELVKIAENVFSNRDKYKYTFALKDINLQTSTYGRIIPIIFGKMKISGNIIWTNGVRKTTSQTPSTRTKTGQSISGTTTVNYYTSVAIAICKGEIDEIEAIYVDDVYVNIGSLDIAIYKGSETQMPNSVIQSHEGAANTPAFRGLCYVVINNFDITQYNGRIPNFSFLVRNNHNSKKLNLKGVCIIPGTGEFVYDTTIQYKQKKIFLNGVHIGNERGEAINNHSTSNKSDSVISFEKMKQELPSVNYTSVVCGWFGTNMNINSCDILPKCEYHDSTTTPDVYSVAGKNRDNIPVIGTDDNGNIRYGGTPDDGSILRYVEYIKSQNCKVCFYPMLMMDVENKPWRGHLTGSVSDVYNFFNKANGYRAFILHYANLLKGKIDSFVIGSEMKGLTKLMNSNGNFPAVDEFCKLAEDVKSILGSGVIVTYAADWSEYHHNDLGYFNLDKLWANSAIDVIGIDAYFPLTNSPDSVYDIDEIANGWESGEGYDFYYSDSSNKVDPQELGAAYAWKNIRYFWENEHFNPNGMKTEWVPKMKKIWFTEYGFPSTDCTTNSPNVFYSPGSYDSGFPHLSKGFVDFYAQKQALFATEKYLEKNSDFIENSFVWSYDARPYPQFPALLNSWSDGGAWRYGHWLNGKASMQTLGNIISKICVESGLKLSDFVVENMDYIIEGMAINEKSTGEELIKMLCEIYNIKSFVEDGVLVFAMRNNDLITSIPQNDIILLDSKQYNSQIETLENKVTNVELLFIDSNDYRINTANSALTKDKTQSVKIPIAMSFPVASSICKNILLDLIKSGNIYKFSVYIEYAYLKAFDVIELQIDKNNTILVEIISISFDSSNNYLDVIAKSTQLNSSEKLSNLYETNYQSTPKIDKTNLFLRNLPFDLIENGKLNEYNMSYIIQSDSSTWSGCDIILQNDEQDILLDNHITETIAGTVIDFVENAEYSHDLLDYISKVTILLDDDADISENTNNICIIDKEIIWFQNITFISDKIYEISVLKRNLYNTKNENGFAKGQVFAIVNSIKNTTLNPDILMQSNRVLAQSSYQAISDATVENLTIEDLKKTAKILNYSVYLTKNSEILITFVPYCYKNINFWQNLTSKDDFVINLFDENNINIFSANTKDTKLLIDKDVLSDLDKIAKIEIIQIFENIY